MPINLADYENKAREAVKVFSGSSNAARARQVEGGRTDQGERAGVTAGKNMDGFVALVGDVVRANGLLDASIMLERRVLTLPGFFRPTKLWDMLVVECGELVAALEFKSHVGPSFGNNFNNRAEEAIGTGHDLWTAYREQAFGRDAPKPFVGWMILIEDAPKARSPVTDRSQHFQVLPEFPGPLTQTGTTFSAASSCRNSYTQLLQFLRLPDCSCHRRILRAWKAHRSHLVCDRSRWTHSRDGRSSAHHPRAAITHISI